jgi:RHS repeat-associated protein
MAGLLQMSKSIGFRRLWITGLLGAWLSIFAGNASAYCTVEDYVPPRTVCEAPAVSITSPANGATYTFPVSFPVTATVDNAGQSISQVAFYVNGAVFQTVTTAPYSVTYTPPTPGTYTFKATATETNHGTRTGTSTAVSVNVNAPLPEAPSGLGAAAADATHINLSWSDNSAYETGFKIERKIGAGGTYGQIATAAANATSYSDPSVSAGNAYYYRVRATNSAGDSTYSNEASVNFVVPNAPSGLTATSSPLGGVSLGWTDNSSDETGFKLERKTGATGTYSQIAALVANTTSFSDSGVSAGFTYYYRIRSTNIVGDSAYSNEASVVDAVPPNITGGTVTYKYDSFGNLIETNAGGVITAITYDVRGRKTVMSDPDMGNWIYAYNALGELIRQKDAKLQTATMTYDKLGRMTNRTEPDLVSTWTYDSCIMGIGKLCQANATNGYSRTHSYDDFGRPKTLAASIDTSYTVTTTYVASGVHAGKIDTLTYPTGFSVKHLYNTLGYVREVGVFNPSANPAFAADGTLLWRANKKSASGVTTEELLGANLTQTRTLDNLDRLSSVVASGPGGTVHSFTYTYDTISNITQRGDSVNTVNETFSYDSLNRLRMVSGTGPTGPLITRSFDYDAIGNMTYKSDVGIYTYPPAGAGSVRPHAVSSVSGPVNATYNYDANGNLFSGAGRTLTYTSFNMPATVTNGAATYTYTYSSDHERVRLVTQLQTGTQTSIYLHPGGGDNLFYEKEIKPDSSIEHKHYVQVGAMLVGVYVTKSGNSPQMHYYLRDSVGSITAVMNETGAPLERLGYEAYGKRRYTDGTADPSCSIFGMTTDRGFTAHEHLDETCLIHMNGRVYDPLLGRFLTADPFVQSKSNLQSYNRYSYVLNNPLVYTDPSGYFNLGKALGLDRPLSAITGTIHTLADSFTENPVLFIASVIVAAETGYWIGEGLALGGSEAFVISTTTIYEGGAVVGTGFTLTPAGMAVVGAGSGFAAGYVASGGNFQAALKAAGSGAALGFLSGLAMQGWEAMADETDRLARLSGNRSSCVLGRPCTAGSRVAVDASGNPVTDIRTTTGFARTGMDPEVLGDKVTRAPHSWDSFPGAPRFVELVSKVHDFGNQLAGAYDTLGRYVVSQSGLYNDLFNVYSMLTMVPAAAYTTFAFYPSGIIGALTVNKEIHQKSIAR